MNKKTFILMSFLNFLAIFWAFELNAQSKAVKDSILKQAIKSVQEIEVINRIIDTKNSITKILPYNDDFKHKTKVIVYFKDSIVRKMLYMGFDESFTSSAKEEYYFDVNGKLMCHINIATGTIAYQIYSEPHCMMYLKNNEQSNIFYKDADALYILTNDKFTVDYYLSNFSDFKYSTFNVDKNDIPILKLTANTTFRLVPNKDGSIVKNLVKGTELFYLDRSYNSDDLNGQGKWVWYRVKTLDGKVGWIWGHPSIVKNL